MTYIEEAKELADYVQNHTHQEIEAKALTILVEVDRRARESEKELSKQGLLNFCIKQCPKIEVSDGPLVLEWKSGFNEALKRVAEHIAPPTNLTK